MRLVGFNFNKINIEKSSDNFKDLKINTNIHISDIKEIQQDLFKSKEEFLGIDFEFTIDYQQDIAKLEFKGKILIAIEQKKAKEILKNWKDKKIDEDFKIVIFNIILKKSNIKAIQLEDDMNLPTHITLPTIRKKENKNEKKN
ncbi:MAG: hypothetical protein ACTSUT_08175 [Promethearchaeota archaeon]